MRIRILGAHQAESRDMRFMSMLVDDHLALDAGGLTSTLTLEEQAGIQAILVSHHHFDHIKDLPMLAHNLWETKGQEVYCTYTTRRMLERHVLNGEVWPAMYKKFPGYHSVVFHSVEPNVPFDLLGYHITPMPMPHTVPTVGYFIERDGKSVFYTADTRGNNATEWDAIRPDLLITETTLSNSADDAAEMFKHTTPMSLGRELRAFHKKQGYYPRTVCIHINPHHDAQIRKELADLSKELKADLTVGYEGMILDI